MHPQVLMQPEGAPPAPPPVFEAPGDTLTAAAAVSVALPAPPPRAVSQTPKVLLPPALPAVLAVDCAAPPAPMVTLSVEPNIEIGTTVYE
jgi:hypothetical protein